MFGLSTRTLARTCSYIESNLAEDLSLADIARAAGVSRAHFARQFRARTGMSPMAYRLHARIEVAKRLLDRGETPIAEVAASLGFCDQSHFSRTFRKMVGVTPRAFARARAEAAG